MAGTPAATSAGSARSETVIMSVPDDIADQLADPDNRDKPIFKDLHTDHPELKVGDRRLLGRYVQVVGSDLIFDSTKLLDNAAGYTACCRRRLVFEHARDHHDPLFQNHTTTDGAAANKNAAGEQR